MRKPAIPWLDPRAVFLAVILALAAGLPLITTSATRRDYFFFDVTLTSDAAGLTWFYWDLGSGINEHDSSAQPIKVERKPVVYRFLMPAGNFRGFRFDPIDASAHLTVRSARIVDAHKNILREFQPEELKPTSAVRDVVIDGSTLSFAINPSLGESSFTLPLTAPLTLSISPLRRIRSALPWMSAAFLIGLLLSSPRLLERFRRPVHFVAARLAAKPRWTIVGIAVAVVAIQAHPVIFFGRSFVSPNNGSLMLYDRHPTLPGATQSQFADTMGSDIGSILFNHLYYPMVERDAWFKDHEIPLWNRYSLGGLPLLGQGQSMIGDPFNLITTLTDGTAWAWDARFLIARGLLAAGLGFAVWMLTRHLPAAALTTIGAGFISFFTFRLNHPANFSLGYSPWILVGWIGLIQATQPRHQLGWLAVLFAANWIEFSSGTMKEATMLMACLNFAGVLQLWLNPGFAGRRRRLLSFVAGAGVIFLLLTAPLWISFLSALRHSYNSYQIPQVQAFALPQIIGLFDDLFYRQNTPEEWVVGPGLNALFLLGVTSWLVTPGAWKQDRAGLALLVAAIVPWAFAFGIVPASLIVKLPFLANIWHVGNTFSCSLIILLAVLAGCGFKQAATLTSPVDGWRRRLLAGAILAGLVSAFILTLGGHPFSLFFQGYAPALGLGVLALILAAGWRVRGEPSSAWVVAVVLGLPLLLWRHGQYLHTPFNHYAFTPGERADFHAKSPAVEFLKSRMPLEPTRVIGLQNNLFPNYSTLLRWESLYGADALRNGYYLELANKLGLGRVWDWAAGTPDESIPGLQRTHDFLNVAYYLADHRDPPFSGLGLQLLGQYDLDVLKSTGTWPRAFFSDQVLVYDSVTDFVTLLGREGAQPFAAVQKSDPAAPALRTTTARRRVIPAMNYALTTNTTSFDVEATGAGVAVLSETYFPQDFRVSVDGKPADYFRVNHAFKGVAIKSPGRHRITFSYWPEYFGLSLVLAAIGAVLLLVGIAALWQFGGKKSSFPTPNSA